jgi:hypothetical protein
VSLPGYHYQRQHNREGQRGYLFQAD